MWIFGKRKKQKERDKPRQDLPKSLVICGWCGEERGVELIEKLYQEPGVTRRFEMLCPACAEKFKQECGFGHTDIPLQEERRQQLTTLLDSLSDFELGNSRLGRLKEVVHLKPAS